ncbi:MAG TPA: hypothetical protein VK348_15955, partial [Planctomycetota bacterium]|nr:hypothetical protein [Planctomycetota bacterium]
PDRVNHAMAFDTAHAQVVLFGGMVHGRLAADTWTYDGVNWREALAVRAPPRREGHVLVQDTWRGRTVLFGGVADPHCFSTSVSFPTDTWEYATAWSPVQTLTSPPPRSFAAATFDAARGRTVMFGGMAPNLTGLADTWEYDGVNWIQVVTTAAPPARWDHSLANDLARGRTVLFGGLPLMPADTWEYDGGNWVQVTTAASPPARSGAGMVYDSARNRVVLNGGFGPGPLADTWEYDGNNWIQVTTAARPRGDSMVMSYDAARGRTVWFGSGGYLLYPMDTWEYDGTSWTQVTSGTGPWGRWATAMAYDPARGRMVLFGGGYSDCSVLLETTFSDTWELLPPRTPTWTRHGTGCAGSNGVPLLAPAPGSVPALGSTLQLQLHSLPAQPGAALLVFGFDFTQWNTTPLPMPLAAVGLPGCSLWIAPVAGAQRFVAHAGGNASVPIAIPANPSLAGVVVATQALVFDPATPSGAAVTNGGILRLF